MLLINAGLEVEYKKARTKKLKIRLEVGDQKYTRTFGKNEALKWKFERSLSGDISSLILE